MDYLDTTRLARLKKLGWMILVLLLMVISFAFGAREKAVKEASQKPKVVKTVTPKQSLTKKDVETFLIAYYTKKDLEENRNRYKPLMTESLYQQELDLENQALNQAYKGYVVDFQYKDADIYIDDERLIALVKVRYSTTLLEKKGSYDKAQKVVNETSMELQFMKQGRKYLLNQKSPITLENLYNEEPDYPDYGSLGEDTEEDLADSSSSQAPVSEHGDVPEDIRTETEEPNGQETQAE